MRPPSSRIAHSTPTASGKLSSSARNTLAPCSPSSAASFGSSPQGSGCVSAMRLRHEIVRPFGEQLVAVVGDEDQVLDAHPSVLRIDGPRLDGDDVAGDER